MIEFTSYEKLEQYINALQNIEELKYGFDISIPESSVYFKDKEKHGCMDGELITILSKLQNRIYKDLGPLVYDKDYKKLTEEEKESLMLRVTVRDGSIWDGFNFTELLKDLIKKMDSKDIKKIIKFIVIAFCILSFAKTAVNNVSAYKLKTLDKEMSAETQAGYMKLSSMFLEYLSSKESVEIDGNSISSDRLAASSDAKSEFARILRSPDEITIRTLESEFYVQDIKNVPEFTAIVMDSNDNAVYKVPLGYEHTDSVEELFRCLRERNKTVRLTISVVFNSNNKPVTSTIERINGKPFDNSMLL